MLAEARSIPGTGRIVATAAVLREVINISRIEPQSDAAFGEFFVYTGSDGKPASDKMSTIRPAMPPAALTSSKYAR